MPGMRKRVYESILEEHLRENLQMAFLSGPRQVGKTTLGRKFAGAYLGWDNQDSRDAILAGPDRAAERAGLGAARTEPPVMAFDEIHRYSRWKTFLKGFFDEYEGRCRVIVTGSARLDVYRKGGDSLMGRYFPYRVHPFSVGEIARQAVPREVVQLSAPIPDGDWEALKEHGGFPEPFTRRDAAFTRRWRRLRAAQLIREDVRDLTRTAELDQMEVLARLLAGRSGTPLVHSSLAGEVRVAENTVKAWIATLKALYYGFTVRPWCRNVENSLRKTPKWYLRDWSGIADTGARFETMVACHLLKAVEGWTDLGLGEFELFYLRDKQKREVDFLVARDGEPWFLAEAKTSDAVPTKALSHFQRATGAPHAFQVVAELPWQPLDCFAWHTPVAVPARTFLSQLP